MIEDRPRVRPQIRSHLLARLPRPFVLLEDRLDPAGYGRLYTRAHDIVRCDRPEDVDLAVARLQRGLDQGLHAAGFLAYELGYALEPRLSRLMPRRRDTPLIWMGLFAPPRRIDAKTLDAACAELGPPPPIRDLVPDHDRAEHMAKVDRVLDLIGAGEIYQANLTFQLRFRYAGDPLAFYAALRCRQPVAHGGLVALEDATIVSASPELFVRIRDGRATCRPMKGTAAREADPDTDQAASRALQLDPKQRAENLMIVDLLRNDLGRISETGSVHTPALFTVETYPTFHTLTSTVTSRLRQDISLADRLRALFPCGSIVGAPKIRAAEIIRGLEPSPRGVYTGAVGAFSPNGDMDLNVAIRTATLRTDGKGVYGVGGGIVADSDPAGEYEEALLKARILYDLAEDFQLIETFRWSSLAGYVHLERHLDRLRTSAISLGFVLVEPQLLTDLAVLDAGWRLRSTEDRRVRVALSRAGGIAITHERAPRPGPLKVCIAEGRLDAGDPYLRHKTSHRAVFDRAFAQATAADCDEALLLNRSGELADASRNSLFVERDGRLLTPPVTAGALPGVLRSVLIGHGRAVEERLILADLRDSGQLFLGNSLNGLRKGWLVV